jgi:hypothetical protein
MKPTIRPSIIDAIPPFARTGAPAFTSKKHLDVPLAMAVSFTFKRYDEENPDLDTDDIIALTASTHDIKRSTVIELLWGMTNTNAIVAATSPTQEN